jgi:hypothetical protein
MAPGAVSRVLPLVSRAAGRAHVAPAEVDVDEPSCHQHDQHEADEHERAHRAFRTRRPLVVRAGRRRDSSSSRLAVRYRSMFTGPFSISSRIARASGHVFEGSTQLGTSQPESGVENPCPRASR